MLIQKKIKQWRMCVDYTDINKAYLKHPFYLRCINQIVDSTSRCNVFFFGVLFLLPLDSIKIISSNQDFVQHTIRSILLHYYAIWSKEREGCILERDSRMFIITIAQNVEAYIDDVAIKPGLRKILSLT